MATLRSRMVSVTLVALLLAPALALKVPPKVEGMSASDAQKLGTVSEDGMWIKNGYYASAAKYMDEQWTTLIYPLIKDSNYTNVLEIAAGACRNTKKLAPLSGHITATDIDASALELCKKEFKGLPGADTKITFSVTDGSHINVSDSTVTFVYQFDAGVHFNRKVIQNYLKEFERVLVPGGTGFFHHSNLVASAYKVVDDMNAKKNPQSRSAMSRAYFEEDAKAAGLEVVCHPALSWAGCQDLDSFAYFRKPGGEKQHAGAHLEGGGCPQHLDTADMPRWKNLTCSSARK